MPSFLKDIREYSHDNTITREFRDDNPYITYYLCGLGNISLLSAWYNGDMEAVAREFIVEPLRQYEKKIRNMGFDQNKIDEELKGTTHFLISFALRNSSEGEVEDLTEIALTQLASRSNTKSYKEGKKEAFMEFQRWGCQIARYRKPGELQQLSERYESSESITIHLENEMAYGEKCFKDAEVALELCTSQEAKSKNKQLNFLKTTPDRQGMRIAVEYLIEQHFLDAVKRNSWDTSQCLIFAPLVDHV